MIDPDELAREVAALAAATGRRFVLGLAGAPASGKSTLAADLAARIPGAVVVPMDGFHLDDKVLIARGDRPRKGAPHTFDLGGFLALLARLGTGEEVFAPEFDRDLEAARSAAIEVPPDAPVVLVEGNYLLHDRDGWEEVRDRLDQCWYLDVPEAELTARLTRRWEGYGLSPAEMDAKINGNDLPNARLVARSRDRADRVLSSAGR